MRGSWVCCRRCIDKTVGAVRASASQWHRPRRYVGFAIQDGCLVSEPSFNVAAVEIGRCGIERDRDDSPSYAARWN